MTEPFEPELSDLYQIKPDPPVFNDADMVVELPEQEGVSYSVSGTPADGVLVTVTASAEPGWVLIGDTTEWSHTFDAEAPPQGDEGATEPVPDPNDTADGSWAASHGQYLSRNAGRRASILEAARQLANVNDVADAVDVAVGGLGDSVALDIHNMGVVLADYGDALERKVEPWAVPTVAPLSQTINRRADPTFQLSDFMVPELPLEGNTAGADGHYHALTGSHSDAGRVERGLGEGWTVGNRTYVAFITPAINRAYEQVNFMVGGISGTPANMDIAIYVADENKILTSQIGVHRVEGIGLGDSLVAVTFAPWIATQGSYIAVAVRQYASGTQRPLLGLYDTPRPLSNAVFPRKITAYRHTSTSALPTTMNGETELDFESDWFTPYIELSEAVGIDYRNFTEGWSYVGDIGRPWVRLTPRGVYSDNGRVGTSGFGYRVSMYDTPLATDFVRVRSSVHTLFDNNQRRSTLAVRGTNNLQSGVGLSVITSSRYELIEWSGRAADSNWDGRTVIRTISRVPREGDQIEVDYLDGYVTVRINGTTYFESQMVGGPQGAAGRFLGIQTERTGNVFVAYPSPLLGPWSARDLPQDVDDDTGGGTG